MTERYQFHFRHILKDGTVLKEGEKLPVTPKTWIYEGGTTMEIHSITSYRPDEGDITSEAAMQAAMFLQSALHSVNELQVGCATINAYEIDTKFYLSARAETETNNIRIEIGKNTNNDSYEHILDIKLKVGDIFEIKKNRPYTAQLVVIRGASDGD